MGGRALALSPPRPSAGLRAYRLLSRALALPLLAWLWWRGRREPGYRQGLKQRLGWVPVDPNPMGGLWLHAASVGEVQAARPLIEALLATWPAHTLLVTTQTPTGAAALKATWGDRIAHRYAPLDTPGAIRRFLDRVQPQRLILMERELWPEWVFACRERAIPVVLVNARMTERSTQGYRRWHSVMQHVWPALTAATADDATGERLLSLGVPADQLRLCGNLKFDHTPPPRFDDLPPALQRRRLVVVGSTHEGDEAAWLAIWPQLASRHPDALLVLVPRHPQRFDTVARELDHQGLSHVRRSATSPVAPETQVLLVDAMGELLYWYHHAAVCFVGGTLAPVGGHNPLEPMSVGQAFLHGPHTENAPSLFTEAQTVGAAQAVSDAESLALAVENALRDTPAWQARGRAARRLMDTTSGATQRVVTFLNESLPPVAPERLRPVAVTVHGQETFWHDPDRLPAVGPLTFDLQRPGNALATGSGRGQAKLVHEGATGLVLRHYRRGGLMARFSDDHFSRQPVHQSRAMREYALLRVMSSWNLPVPEPAIARHHPHGWQYTADIAVVLVPDSRNLVQHLRQDRPTPATWAALGQAIRQLHNRQVFHADLNAHNLLLDANGAAWVVDFDKCDVRPGEDWKAHNLARLLRSLRKEATRNQPFLWHEEDWPRLVDAYQTSVAQT